MPGTIPTIRPADQPLTRVLYRRLVQVMREVVDGEKRGDPRRFGIYRVLERLSDKDPLRIKLVGDIAKQEELTTQCMTSIMLNGLYPSQFKYPPLFAKE